MPPRPRRKIGGIRMARTKKQKTEDPFAAMEALLFGSLAPRSGLYRYMEAQLSNGEKPDPKPLKEVLGVLQQLRELRGGAQNSELRVVFEDETARRWSE